MLKYWLTALRTKSAQEKVWLGKLTILTIDRNSIDWAIKLQPTKHNILKEWGNGLTRKSLCLFSCWLVTNHRESVLGFAESAEVCKSLQHRNVQFHGRLLQLHHLVAFTLLEQYIYILA